MNLFRVLHHRSELIQGATEASFEKKRFGQRGSLKIEQIVTTAEKMLFKGQKNV